MDLSKIRFYETVWNESSFPEVGPLPSNKLWIIFVDEDRKITQRLNEALLKQHQQCVLVERGKEFVKHSDEHFTIDPLTTTDYQKLFDNIPQITLLTGIIYLWGSCAQLPKDLESLETFHKLSFISLVNLANALDDLSSPLSLNLWVVTQSLITDGDLKTLAEWPQSSLCKVIQEEYPKLKCCYVALNPDSTLNTSSEELLLEIASKKNTEGEHEREIGWRWGKRLVPRLVPIEVVPHQPIQFSAEASYLIAGGLGSIGLKLAHWYVAHGAKYLILLDENEMTEETLSSVNELINLNVSVIVHKARFDNEASLRDLLKKIQKPLKGVIHTTNVLDTELLRHTTWDSFQLYRLRITGSWYLHQLTQDINLDHFILFSSGVLEFAPLGKAKAAFAWSFLDALSYYRKKKNLPSLSIDWGPWSRKQVTVKHVIEYRPILDRFHTFTFEEAFQLLETSFYHPQPQIMTANINWRLVFSSGVKNHLFDEIN